MDKHYNELDEDDKEAFFEDINKKMFALFKEYGVYGVVTIDVGQFKIIQVDK